MNYAKPEMVILGTAVHVIEQIPIVKGYTSFEFVVPPKNRINPAYDLDE
jgi:hypothetical protein